MTQCECPIAGFCQRHQVEKPDGWWKLCQTRERYFAAWESGRGPGQSGRRPKPTKRRSKKPPLSDKEKEQRRKKAEEAKIKNADKGRAAWAELHAVINPTPAWYAEWLKTIPSFGCGCRMEWDMLTQQHPPDFDNFAQWAIDRHNDVNKKLGKPVWQPSLTTD